MYPIQLIDCKTFFKNLPHQIIAIDYLGELLLKTPAASKLHLINKQDWIKLNDVDLIWLQKQITLSTLSRFAVLYRSDSKSSLDSIKTKYFSQRDNKINWAVSCNSSSHAMYVDYFLRLNGRPGLSNDDDFISRVYSNKYGSYGRNNSLSWDLVHRVCYSFGVHCKYVNFTKKLLIHSLLKDNYITCVNIFHKGLSRSSRSGGHVIVLADYLPDTKQFLVYDPWGSQPSNNYLNKSNGIYYMPESEFDWRWQGIYTEFIKMI